MALTVVDELKSLRRYVHDLYPNVPIQIERDRNGFSRPAFFIEQVQTVAGQLVRRASTDTTSWQVTYFGTSKLDAMAVIGAVKAVMRRDKYMPAYLFDFVHPDLLNVQVVADATSTLPAGSYAVAVTGIGRDGAETLPSTAANVTVAAGQAISFRIPRLSKADNPFSTYAVYLNGLQAETVPLDGVGNTDVTVTAPAPVGAASPPTKSAVQERTLRIDGDITVNTVEDADSDGNHNGIMTVHTAVTVPITETVGEKIGKVVQSLSITYGQ